MNRVSELRAQYPIWYTILHGIGENINELYKCKLNFIMDLIQKSMKENNFTVYFTLTQFDCDILYCYSSYTIFTSWITTYLPFFLLFFNNRYCIIIKKIIKIYIKVLSPYEFFLTFVGFWHEWVISFSAKCYIVLFFIIIKKKFNSS